eukprot:13893818-Alexandrium_andersonii.AAC.1
MGPAGLAPRAWRGLADGAPEVFAPRGHLGRLSVAPGWLCWGLERQRDDGPAVPGPDVPRGRIVPQLRGTGHGHGLRLSWSGSFRGLARPRGGPRVPGGSQGPPALSPWPPRPQRGSPPVGGGPGRRARSNAVSWRASSGPSRDPPPGRLLAATPACGAGPGLPWVRAALP